MLIVGELINTSRKAVNEAVENRNAEYIKQVALEQVQAGADYVDVNCGTMVFNEAETMEWLVTTVQDAVQVPLCIDSPDPKALEAGLALCKFGQPLINSITGEIERFESILPLVLKYKAKIVALCMDDTGIPDTGRGRSHIAGGLYARLTAAGVQEEDIYFDPLVQPISSHDKAGINLLEAIRLIKEQHPNAHQLCGLSNVSYGLPNRKVLNRLFAAQTMALGMDGYILNPLDREMVGAVHACKALLGQDAYCMGYLTAHRRGLYQKKK
jgi:5-methyltetrahydrofolate--homocysteine methyltransferase